MTYTAALFEPGDDLETAQLRKIDHHIGQSEAQGKERLLDVGCGWGATMRRAVAHAGVRSAVGLTLSRAQADYVRATANDARIEVRIESWEDYRPSSTFGAIISIGAFEHFATPDMNESAMVAAYRRFFAACHQWLDPNGCLSLQTIAYGTARRADINRFVLEHVFPESDLPTLEAIVKACDPHFEIVNLRNDRGHYADTLRAWSARLDAVRDQALEMVGPETLERYRRYLGLFTIGFHTGAMTLLRLKLRRRPAAAAAGR
jgi:cyclopropane-fatty-acyl-phospholipid synthase